MGEHAPASPGPPRAACPPARPPAGEPLSRAWPVRVRLPNRGSAGRLGTGLGRGTDLGPGGLGSRRSPRPRGPARSGAGAARPSTAGRGQVPPPSSPRFSASTPLLAGDRARPPAPSLRGVARCGAARGPVATRSKLSGSGPSEPGAEAAPAPADPLQDRRRRPSFRAQTWSA